MTQSSLHLFGLTDFFSGVTWGQIVATATITIILSVLTTLLVEYFAKPSLEIRKHKKLRDETLVDEILFKISESKAALTVIVEFDKFKKGGGIIPTHQHMLSQQLKHLQVATEQVQQNISRLPKKYKLIIGDTKKAHSVMADLEAAAIKTKSNVENNKHTEFKSVNQRTLSNYLPKIDDITTLFGDKK